MVTCVPQLWKSNCDKINREEKGSSSYGFFVFPKLVKDSLIIRTVIQDSINSSNMGSFFALNEIIRL